MHLASRAEQWENFSQSTPGLACFANAIQFVAGVPNSRPAPLTNIASNFPDRIIKKHVRGRDFQRRALDAAVEKVMIFRIWGNSPIIWTLTPPQ
jgi:hypothetical protein